MEEQFVLRVPPSVAERIEHLLNEDASSSEDKSLDLSFSGEMHKAAYVVIYYLSISRALVYYIKC